MIQCTNYINSQLYLLLISIWK